MDESFVQQVESTFASADAAYREQVYRRVGGLFTYLRRGMRDAGADEEEVAKITLLLLMVYFGGTQS